MAAEQASTIAELLKLASTNVESCDYDVAYNLCNQALEKDPNNLEALEMTGVVELELGSFDSAREHLLKAVSLNPDQGYSKYMYLGQLSHELESVGFFSRGVELMGEELKTLQENSPEALELARKISSALCSMAEIYLTDCCFEPNAESQCETFVNSAITVDPNNPEVYQTLASIRLSQQRNEDAKEALEKSMSLWSNLEPGHPGIPNYDARIGLVKLLMEMGLFDVALNVLEGLQKEDDEVVELWYLYGWAYYLLGEDKSDEEKASSWEDARDCLESAIKYYHKLGSEDEGILQHCQELLQVVISVVGPSVEEEEIIDEDVEFVSDDDMEE
ncbi:TPR-like protein [Basidiobolus meristosporus CBS 931.73]|uniref:TPR-like protein n=1 Tax=Basidiobolus meristosporus CBS 931.73 TaxID=1314790 RepID=A0A1Y1Y749_9FUNG|nr:TPR-like protein [Basidiobolus meristosporus CBS 931.73]|eukprot:ORX93841.1 TPR-like protein [Basidiobolus meristosporus CBS 931.73]